MPQLAGRRQVRHAPDELEERPAQLTHHTPTPIFRDSPGSVASDRASVPQDLDERYMPDANYQLPLASIVPQPTLPSVIRGQIIAGQISLERISAVATWDYRDGGGRD